jgi:hypothetical protein
VGILEIVVAADLIQKAHPLNVRLDPVDLLVSVRISTRRDNDLNH